MARLPFAALLRTVRPVKPPSVVPTTVRARAERAEAPAEDAPPTQPEPAVATYTLARRAHLDARHLEPGRATVDSTRIAERPDPPMQVEAPPRLKLPDETIRTGDPVGDRTGVRIGEPPTKVPEPRPAPEPEPGPAPAPPSTSTGTFAPEAAPTPPPSSEFEPDDWSYDPTSGLWYSGADGQFHAEPGSPPVPPEDAPDGVPAGPDLLADAVVLDGLGVDVHGDWTTDADLEVHPLDGDDVWFDAEDGVFRDGGPDGAIIGFHESALADARAYPNRSVRVRYEDVDPDLDGTQDVTLPYQDFAGPDLLFAGGHWYAQEPDGWHQLPEGRYLDLGEVQSDIGDFLEHEATVGTALYGLEPRQLGFVLDGATGQWHSHDPTAWDWDETSQAWVDADGSRFDRPGGRTLGPDEISQVGDYDSGIPLDRLSPVQAADGTLVWYDAETGGYSAFETPNWAMPDPPVGPYRYLGPTGPGAPDPLDDLEPGTTVYLDPETEAFHLDSADGTILDFHPAADAGAAFHNQSFDDLDPDDAPYLDFTGPDLQYVNGTWYAHEQGQPGWQAIPEGRYLDVGHAQADLGDYLNHEVTIGTPMYGQLQLEETTLVIDGETGELHAYDPERWHWDEDSQAWIDEDGSRHRLPDDSRALADDEVSDIGFFDSAVDLDHMAMVRAEDGSTYWYDLDDGTYSEIGTPGVPRPGDPPEGPFTVRADGPYDQPPLDALEPGTTVWFDPDTNLYRSDGPDGPVMGFHSGAAGHVYTDPGLARQLAQDSIRVERADLRFGDGDLRAISFDQPAEQYFQVDGHWYDGAGNPLDLPANPRLGDLPPGLRRAVLADAGLEGAAELELADDLVLDGDTGELHLFDPDAFTWDPTDGTWIDVATGEAVADPLDYEATEEDAYPDADQVTADEPAIDEVALDEDLDGFGTAAAQGTDDEPAGSVEPEAQGSEDADDRIVAAAEESSDDVVDRVEDDIVDVADLVESASDGSDDTKTTSGGEKSEGAVVTDGGAGGEIDELDDLARHDLERLPDDGLDDEPPFGTGAVTEPIESAAAAEEPALEPALTDTSFHELPEVGDEVVVGFDATVEPPPLEPVVPMITEAEADIDDVDAAPALEDDGIDDLDPLE